MDPNPSAGLIESAIKKAVVYSAIAVIGFIALGFLALYWPEDKMLRQSEYSKVKTWFSGGNAIPSGMIFVDESKTTNSEVADNYPAEGDMLSLLEEWGRKEGFAKLYVAPDRCTSAGPRSITVSIVLLNDPSGTQQYYAWLREYDQDEGDEFETVPIGSAGYQFWSEIESSCSDAVASQIEICFRRNNALGVVKVAGSTGQASLFLDTARQLATILDEILQQKTSQQ